MIYSLGDRKLELRSENYFIADSADVIGSVILEENASIWFNCVIRGDNEPIHIGKGSNVQDGSVFHTDHGFPLTIGEGVTVGHMVMLHGCTVGDNTIIGMNSTVLNGTKIGKNCIIGAGSMIPEGKEIPDNSLVLGSHKNIKEIGDKHMALIKMSSMHYVENHKRYLDQLEPDERFGK